MCSLDAAQRNQGLPYYKLKNLDFAALHQGYDFVFFYK